MSDKIERLEALLKQYITDSKNYIDTKIGPDRSTAYEYYYGQLPAPKKNSPSIVKKVVFEKVQQALPQIKEPFMSGRDVVKFLPYNTSDEKGASIASAVVNKILKTDNNIDVVYDQLVLDGLIAKTGTIKVSWEEKYDYYDESFTGLSAQALEILLDDDDVELVEKTENDPVFDLPYMLQMVDPQVILKAYPKGPMELAKVATDWDSLVKALPMFKADIETMREAGKTYSGTIERKVDCSTVKVTNVAPENFLVDEKATAVEDAKFVAERCKNVTISDLLEMGFSKSKVDEVAERSSEDSYDYGTVETSRNSLDFTDTDTSSDSTVKYVDLYECYIRTSMVEYDEESGKTKRAKLYQMYYANGVLLEYSEVDTIPFFMWTPLPVAHKLIGQSMAETLFEEQDTATHALRGAIQYLAFSTNPRYKATPETEYNLAAFQANLPGSVVPINKGDLVPFDYPRIDQGIFQILGTITDNSDQVSGVSNLSAGLDSNALRSNVAASTVAMQMDASQRRLKGYAKNLAVQCIKPAYGYVYELYRKNAKKNIIVNVDGRDIQVDPQSLPIRKYMDVDYSLGRNDKIEHGMQLLAVRDRIMNTPQLQKYHTPSQAFQLEHDIQNNFGVFDISRYISNPVGEPVQPTVAEMQAQQAQQQQLAMQQEQQKIQLLAEQNRQLELQNKQKELAIKEQQVQMEAIVAQANIELKKIELEFKQDVAADEQNRKDAELQFKQEAQADRQTLEENALEVEALKATAEIKLETAQQRGVDIQ